ESDQILRCDEVRNTLGIDGTNVRVGVISTGIDHIASSQATGDAPQVTVPNDPHCHQGSGDEGSAMIEIIHDGAPGAAIGFCGPMDDLEFIDCLTCLQQAFGAQVMVDDLGNFLQPYFADGPVAQAVSDIVGQGVAYFTAAGNNGRTHYQGTYRP